MATLRPARRMLPYGIIFGVLAFAASPSGAWVVGSPSPTATVEALLFGQSRGDFEASLQYVHWGRFCRWYPKHRLCLQLAMLRRFCDWRPNHPLCDDDDQDRFCRKHPRHHRCDDTPPSPS